LSGLPVEVTVLLVAFLASLAGLARGHLVRSRHRTAVNRALHELRRPLQAMALLLPEYASEGGPPVRWAGGLPRPVGPEPIRQAIEALRHLDGEVNGRPVERRSRELLAARLMADACVRRWAAHARLNGSEVGLAWTGPDLLVRGDAIALAGAIENLILNAIQHGGSEITVHGGEVAGRLRIAVEDRGPARHQGERSGVDPEGIGDVAGHGLGLGIARETVLEHGGRFECEFGDRRSVVELFLPIARPGVGGRGRVKVNW
jgi:signal transduction histidine kinase